MADTAADCQRTSKAIDRAVQTYVARTTPVHQEHHCAWYNAACQVHKVVHAAKALAKAPPTSSGEPPSPSASTTQDSADASSADTAP